MFGALGNTWGYNFYMGTLQTYSMYLVWNYLACNKGVYWADALHSNTALLVCALIRRCVLFGTKHCIPVQTYKKTSVT